MQDIPPHYLACDLTKPVSVSASPWQSHTWHLQHEPDQWEMLQKKEARRTGRGNMQSIKCILCYFLRGACSIYLTQDSIKQPWSNLVNICLRGSVQPVDQHGATNPRYQPEMQRQGRTVQGAGVRCEGCTSKWKREGVDNGMGMLDKPDTIHSNSRRILWQLYITHIIIWAEVVHEQWIRE